MHNVEEGFSARRALHNIKKQVSIPRTFIKILFFILWLVQLLIKAAHNLAFLSAAGFSLSLSGRRGVSLSRSLALWLRARAANMKERGKATF
jgi:hypothetical protein